MIREARLVQVSPPFGAWTRDDGSFALMVCGDWVRRRFVLKPEAPLYLMESPHYVRGAYKVEKVYPRPASIGFSTGFTYRIKVNGRRTAVFRELWEWLPWKSYVWFEVDR